MVYGVRPSSLLVFVPKFHLKGSVHLTDRAGLVRLPVTAPGQDADDAFATSQRRQYKLESGLSGMCRPASGNNVICVALLSHWLRLYG